MPEHVKSGGHPKRPSQADLAFRLEECRARIDGLRVQVAKLVMICNRLANDLPEDVAMKLRQDVDDARS